MVPSLKPVNVAAGNRDAYDEVCGKLDSFTFAHATAAVALTQDVYGGPLMRMIEALPALASYRYDHFVYGMKDRFREIHLNQLLDGEGKPRYALASFFSLNGIEMRAFANTEVMGRLLGDIRGSGYGIQEFDAFRRTYKRMGRIDLLLNERADLNAALDAGFVSLGGVPSRSLREPRGYLEAAIFTQDSQSWKDFRAFVTEMGIEAEMGGRAGPMTGAGRVSGLQFVHKAPPVVKDLSVPEYYDEFVRLIKHLPTA